MKINDIISFLESKAHPSLQEQYDNAGLITGDPNWDCSGIMVSLDATEDVINEARSKKCNLVVAHHPIIFGVLKKINGKNYVEKTVITAIKHDIAIYSIHTNLDNVLDGVSGRMARLLGLQNVSVLAPRERILKKLFTFAPIDKAKEVREALFSAGAGQIGNYSECSFNSEGTGTFKAGTGTDPYVGEKGKQHEEKEVRIEVIFPEFLEHKILTALRSAHPYEEIAYDIISLSNTWTSVGSGALGELPKSMTEADLIARLKDVFKVPVIRHTRFTGSSIKKIAVCGGAGSFLISKALTAGADAYITADMKYHEFFDANDRILIADIGHYESEQHTMDLLQEILAQNFPTFAVLKTTVNTNPVHYT